jgi:hypothetical protein
MTESRAFRRMNSNCSYEHNIFRLAEVIRSARAAAIDAPTESA